MAERINPSTPEVSKSDEQTSSERSSSRLGEFFARFPEWIKPQGEKNEKTDDKTPEQSKDDDKEDDEEKESSKEASPVEKRWRSLFGKIFPGIVSRDKVTDTKKEPEQSLFSFSSEEPPTTEEDRSTGVIDEGEVTPMTTPIEASSVIPKESSDSGPAETTAEAEDVAPTAETPTHREEETESLSEVAAPDSPEREPPDPPEPPTPTLEAPPPPLTPERSVATSGTGERIPPAREVHSVKDGEPLATLVGLGLVAEHIGRKRQDAKIRAGQADQTKRIENFQITQEELKNRQQAQEQLQKRANERIERVELTTKAPQSVDKLPGRHAEPSEKVIQATPNLRPELRSTQEFRREAPDFITASEEAPELKKLIEVTQKTPNPEVVLHKVEEAAEKNVPLEALYELRHEVKDRPDHEKTGVVGSELEHASRGGNSPDSLSGSSMPSPTSFLSTDSHPELYRKAAISGVWVGLIVLLCAAFYFLFG